MFAKDKVTQSMIDAVNKVLAEKKMEDKEVEESGLRKKAHASAAAGKKSFEFLGKTLPVTVKKEEKKVEEGFGEMDKYLKDKEKEKGTGKYDKKKISTGTVYTKKYKKDKEEIKEEHEDAKEDEMQDKKILKSMVKKSALKDDESKESKKDNEKKEMSEERHMTGGEKEKREKIVKSMKKGLAGFKDRYGDRAKNVMYATATKQAMKEEEELEEALKGKQFKIDKNHNGKIDKQDFEILRKEDIGGISTISEKKKGMKEVKEAEEAEYVRMEPNEDMKTKSVDTLAGRKKVGADYHNQTKSYKLKLNVEGKGTDVDPNFVTNESTPMKMAKDLAKKSFKKIRTETLGMAGATSEEKKKW